MYMKMCIMQCKEPNVFLEFVIKDDRVRESGGMT